MKPVDNPQQSMIYGYTFYLPPSVPYLISFTLLCTSWHTPDKPFAFITWPLGQFLGEPKQGWCLRRGCPGHLISSQSDQLHFFLRVFCTAGGKMVVPHFCFAFSPPQLKSSLTHAHVHTYRYPLGSETFQVYNRLPSVESCSKYGPRQNHTLI